MEVDIASSGGRWWTWWKVWGSKSDIVYLKGSNISDLLDVLIPQVRTSRCFIWFGAILGGFYFKWVYSWITIAIKLMFNLVKKRLRCFTEIFFKRNYIYICLTAVPSVSSYWASQAASEDGLRQHVVASNNKSFDRLQGSSDPTGSTIDGRKSPKNDKWLM